MKSRMRENCKSGSVRGCKTEPLTQTKHWVKERRKSRKSTRRRLICGFAAKQGPDKGGRIDIAGTVTALCDFPVFVIGADAVVLNDNTGFPGFITDTGQDNGFRPGACKPIHQIVDVSSVILFPVFCTCQEDGFGDIRKNNIRGEGETLHCLDIFRVEGGIELPVIGHSGIHNAHGAVRAAGADDVPDIVDLFCTAQVSGIDRVKEDPFLCPVGRNGRNVLGQITDSEATESCGVSRENG